ncbi:hypothetical protein EDB89DRAFT_1905048 [Lactarius sanguifluus]|nr:hypothetical protein EDB89DRAFT_1905048 [Lactarius sanguifluus]
MSGGSSATTDQCALRSDGTLKDASEIKWYNDKDDDMPSAVPPNIVPTQIASPSERKKRKRNTARMEEIIRAEQESDESVTFPLPRQKKKKRKRKPEVLSDPEDKPYTSVASGFDSESDGSSIAEIAPDEVHLDPHNCHICSPWILDRRYVTFEDETPEVSEVIEGER